VDMSVFPSEKHLSSWAGMCPGNNESAGKSRSGKTTKGNRNLRRALCQAAWGASHTKDTYFSEAFHRWAARRGKKRAIVAVGHALLVTVYHMLRTKKPYQDLGADHFDRLDPERQIRYHVRRLADLGKKVTLEPAA
jgi:transposase